MNRGRRDRLPNAARFAQVVAHPLDLVVRLSPPLDAASGVPMPEDAFVAGSLARAIVDAPKAGHAQRLDPKGFSVETLWADGRLWFAPPTAIADQLVGLDWDPAENVPLEGLLGRIAQAEMLVRMLESVAGEPSLLNTCDPTGGTCGAASAQLRALLAARARRPDLRGSLGGFSISDICVDRYSWQIFPREEALRRGGRQVVFNGAIRLVEGGPSAGGA